MAKRLFVNGVEITPVPPDAIFENLSTSVGKRVLIEDCIRRGYTRMSTPETVQSILSNEKDYATLTFPLYGTSTPLKGLRECSLQLKNNPSDPRSSKLDPRWFFWDQGNRILTQWDFEEIFRRFISDEAEAAMKKASDDVYKMLKLAGSDSPLYRGGDWQPRINQIGEPLFLILKEMVQTIKMGVHEFRRTPVKDINLVFAKFHALLVPDDLLGRKRRVTDEKEKTKVYLSKLVRHCMEIRDTKLAFRQFATPLDKKPGFRLKID
jgi:hypothetical protein